MVDELEHLLGQGGRVVSARPVLRLLRRGHREMIDIVYHLRKGSGEYPSCDVAEVDLEVGVELGGQGVEPLDAGARGGALPGLGLGGEEDRAPREAPAAALQDDQGGVEEVEPEIEPVVEEGVRESEPLDGAARGLGEGPEEADDEGRARHGQLEAAEGQGDAELEEVPLGELAALPPAGGLREVRLDDALLAEVDEDVLRGAQA